MGVHEQHYPPQTMPRITRLLVDIPERNGQGKEQQILLYTLTSSLNHTLHGQMDD